MKAKKGFLLRKMGKEFMLVPIGEESRQFNGLIRLNGAGAWLWEQLAEEITEEEMVRRMCDYYEGLDAQTASADLKEFLAAVSLALE